MTTVPIGYARRVTPSMEATCREQRRGLLPVELCSSVLTINKGNVTMEKKINWDNLTFEQAGHVILKLAFKVGWERACAIAKAEMGEDAEEAIRLAFVYEARLRY